jgi:hypothetical protein
MPSDSVPPAWLLDVDGVVNALAPGAPSEAWPPEAWVRTTVRADVPDRGAMTLPVLAARPVLDFITRVHGSGAAEIRWHSTWRTSAVTALAPALGLPPIPISIAPEWAASAAMWWKIPAARRIAEAGQRLIWTDDQLAFFRTDPLSAAELDALDRWDGALLLATDPAVGLSPDDLRRIEKFLTSEVIG